MPAGATTPVPAPYVFVELAGQDGGTSGGTRVYVRVLDALSRPPLFSDPFAKRFLSRELVWAERAARFRPRQAAARSPCR